jgi:hypothetical protein
MAGQGKSTFENINDLLRALAWPLLILLAFLVYRTEFNAVIRLIPEKIRSSSKITVGSLSLEIERTAREQGETELGAIIQNLSEPGIRKLLTLGSGSHSLAVRDDIDRQGRQKNALSLPPDLADFLELEKSGLLDADEPIETYAAYFRSLADKSTRYRSPEGNTSDRPATANNVKFDHYSIPTDRLTAAEKQHLEQQSVWLSEKGRKAFDIIVKVVGEQIQDTR